MNPQFNFIGIVAHDIPESLRFYALLGVPVPESGEDHVQCKLPNGMSLAWDTLELIQKIDEHWEEPKGHRIGIGFECGSPAEVDATFARIVEAGFKGRKAPWDAFWGQRYAQIEDPDGNVVDLFAPLT
ncbi:MAG: VOC family protein [Fimbriimonas sp.]